jgi:hypothetical protein
MIVVLLLVAGQAAAASRIACASMTFPAQLLEQPLAADAVNHSQHMDMVSASDNQPAPDCRPDCNCIAGSCSSLVGPAYQEPRAVTLTSPVESFSDKTLNQLSISLFRPPITH